LGKDRKEKQQWYRVSSAEDSHKKKRGNRAEEEPQGGVSRTTRGVDGDGQKTAGGVIKKGGGLGRGSCPKEGQGETRHEKKREGEPET